MLTAKSALLWEIRRALFPAVLTTLCLLLFFASMPSAPNAIMRVRGQEVALPQVPLQVQFPMIVLSLTLCLFAIGQSVGLSSRQYSLPITSRLLASIRLLPAAFSCGAVYLVGSSLLNIVFRSAWPVYSPAVTFTVGYMVVYAAIALFRGNDVRIAIVGAFVGVLLICWIGGHYGERWWLKLEHSWPALTATELVFLTIVGFAAWSSLVATIDRDRRGAGWGRVIQATDVDALTVAVLGARRRPLRPFFSGATALFWQEWRQDGWLIFLVVVGLHVVLATVQSLGSLFADPTQYLRFDHEYEISSLIMGLWPACAILPWFMGLTGYHGKRAFQRRTWPTSQSTLPLSDTALGWIYVARVIASSLVTAVGVLFVAGLWYGATELIGMAHGEIPLHRRAHGFADFSILSASTYVVLILLTLWLTAGLSCAATLTGRPWIAGLPLILAAGWYLVMIGTTLIWEVGLRQRTPIEELEVLGTFVLALCVIAMLFAYMIGMVYDIIRPASAVFGLLLVIGFGGILTFVRYAAFPRMPLDMAEFQLLLVVALAAAPPAFIPLATYYNRHR